ncbi:penicillin-binding protein 2 [hot springs metagenome]|uniref:Penicillin-binding protein 2 n=1 Tax=hot springs metagenome TaxID=433727 RepID=A0A5J4L3Q0_9ZZZZ
MIVKRIQLGSYIIIGILLILCFRLWQLQILDSDKYKRLSEDNRLRILKTPAPRGIIYDRNGTPLVKNIPFFSVSITTDNFKGIDIDSLSAILGLSKKEVEEKLYRKDNSPFVPVKLKQGLTFEEIARIEARRSDFPGLFVETDVGREYLFGKVGAHIIGYLGKITSSQLNNPELRHFPPDALIGQWGVEALFDSQLRGIPGERIIEVDALGRELRKIQERPPVKGTDINLSIDINIQKAVEDAFGDKAGALVAIKPDSGEILALESLPSFDPNVFSMGITANAWKSLMEDKKKPMLNRAIQSQYPPGSTFKIITAIAALEEGVINLDAKVNCTGGINYGRWTFGCWKKGGHGLVDFHRAIVESCDVYFYELGKRLGIDRIYKYATAFGLGKETGIDLMPVKEKRGLIPNTEWKKQKKHLPWYLGDTFISSIGQGFITATPMQMALMTATFANGGKIYKPSLIKNNQSLQGIIPLRQETIKIIKEALSGVVNEPNGTAQGAKSFLTVVAGKTGTAQVVGKKKGLSGERFTDHAWFVAFAPVDRPEIALSVFVEHGGSGGAAAAPIAKRAIEAYLKGQEPRVTSQDPGSRNQELQHGEN